MDWFAVTASWYLASLVVTLCLAPIAFMLFAQLGDHGATVARPIASLIMIWPVWLLAGVGSGFVPFRRISLVVAVISIGALAWTLARRRGVLDRAAIRQLIVAEVGFFLCFAAFIWFRGYSPAIWEHEKPSDLMMLSSTMRAEQMPPRDAWLANETINYYYIGYVVWAGIAKLSGATPTEAYNLGLASGFGMTVVAVAGLAWNVLRPWFSRRRARLGAGLATVSVVLLGNPWAAGTMLANPTRQWDADRIPGPANGFVKGIGWESTRIIFDDAPHNPITEFPIFSFILSDFHPHLIAYPFTATALTLAWAMIIAKDDGVGGPRLRGMLMHAAFTGGVIGALYGMNAWDYPTYLLIGLLALWIGTRRRPWHQRLAAGAVLAAASVLCWLPFHVHFVPPTVPADHALARATEHIPVLGGIIASIALFDADRTSVLEYVSMFGFMYVVAVALLCVETWRQWKASGNRAVVWSALAGSAVLVLGAVALKAPLLVLLGVPLLLIGLLIARDPRLSAGNVALGCFGIAFVLTLGPEFFYLTDFFDARMNTVFKIYFQVWLLMGLASGITIVLLGQELRRLRWARVVLAAGVAVILLGGLTYPVVAGKQWLDWRNPGRVWVGIDGLAYLDSPTAPGSYASLDWLWTHAKPDDVMLSAGGCEWSAMVGRPAAVTGVPTILGWAGHEEQWHLNPDDPKANSIERAVDIRALFSELSPELLDEYGVTLIYIGPSELAGSDAKAGYDCAPGPFPNARNPDFPGAGWTEVFAEGDVRIYRRDGS